MQSPATSHRWWILAAVSLTQLLTVLDGTIINVALPRAQADLGLSDALRQWVVTAYALVFGSFLLLGGRIADFWGRKRTYLLGLGMFGLGSAWGGLTDSATQFLLARGAQGLAAALLAPSALAFVTLSFPDGRERNRAFAIFGSLAGLGSAAGMVLGGVLTELLSWRWCLLINVPLVVIGWVVAVRILPESRAGGTHRYDVLGALTCTLGFGALVFGLAQAEHSLFAPIALAPTLAGLALLVVFVQVERRTPAPLFPLRILQDRRRATAFIVQALLGVASMGTMVYLALELQLVLGLSPLQAGLATLPFTVSLMGIVPVSIMLFDRFGPRLQMVIGPAISAVGMLILSRPLVDGSYLALLPGVILMGLGMGLAVVPLNNLALYHVEPRDAGVASAAVTATNQLGGSIGLAVLTAVYTVVVAGAVGASNAAEQGYRAVFLAGAVAFGLTALAAVLLLPKGHRATQEAATATPVL